MKVFWGDSHASFDVSDKLDNIANSNGKDTSDVGEIPFDQARRTLE